MNTRDACCPTVIAIEENPSSFSRLLELPETRVNRVLRQESVRAFVIKNGVATSELLENLLHTRFKSFGVSGEERWRPFLNELEPGVVAHASNVDVMLQNLLLDCAKNVGSFAVAQ